MENENMSRCRFCDTADKPEGVDRCDRCASLYGTRAEAEAAWQAAKGDTPAEDFENAWAAAGHKLADLQIALEGETVTTGGEESGTGGSAPAKSKSVERREAVQKAAKKKK